MKDKSNKTGPARLSRRDLVRTLSVAAAGVSMVPGVTLCYGEQSTHKAAHKSSKPVAGASVFQDDRCRENNSTKYNSYDKDVVYPLLAFWLMLTTDEWDSCLDQDAWRARLAAELGLRKEHMEELYKTSHDSSKKPGQVFSNAEAFARVKETWQSFIQSHAFYGFQPCPGGKTLLQIAKGCK